MTSDSPLLAGLAGGGVMALAMLLAALQCAVLAPAWLLAAGMLPPERRAAMWCAGHAALAGLALGLAVLGLDGGAAWLGAGALLLALAALAALQRGLWALLGHDGWVLQQNMVLALAAALLLPAMVADSLASAAWPGVLACGAMGLLQLWVALDVWRQLGLRQVPPGLALLCGATMGALGALLLVVPGLAPRLMPPGPAGTDLTGWLGAGGLVAGAMLIQLTLLGMLAARMMDRMAQLSRHDALTGLLNRRAIDQLLQQEEHRVRRLSGQMAVLMVDIDHFKRINDTKGHAAGDHALQHLAAVMAANLRQIDHLARWGGEEFLAMLPATTADEAMVLAERLRERIAAVPVIIDGQRLHLSASIGVSAWMGQADTRDALLTRADIALYQAKRDGRDCVRRHNGTRVNMAVVRSA